MKAVRWNSRHAAALAALLAIFLAPVSGRAQSMPIENLSQFPRATLIIAAGGQSHRFDAWIADTTARQAQGLMFVRDLPADQAMIFPMVPPRVAQFWMKNTYIPLDMLFVAPDGRIEKIAANTKPFSLAVIGSGEPVRAVIEIRGGEAHSLGIAVGARVSWARAATK